DVRSAQVLSGAVFFFPVKFRLRGTCCRFVAPHVSKQIVAFMRCTQAKPDCCGVSPWARCAYGFPRLSYGFSFKEIVNQFTSVRANVPISSILNLEIKQILLGWDKF
ncbi:hypothetical protein EGW08_005443, partial [Elysia chlorotica]